MAIEKRPFGKTGHDSSAIIFGAAALKAKMPVAELEKIREATAQATARSMSQREVLAATFWICVAVSYN